MNLFASAQEGSTPSYFYVTMPSQMDLLAFLTEKSSHSIDHLMFHFVNLIIIFRPNCKLGPLVLQGLMTSSSLYIKPLCYVISSTKYINTPLQN